MTDVQTAGWIAKESDGKFELLADPVLDGMWGYGFEKGSSLVPAFKAALDKFVKSGEYQKILAKWGVEALALDEIKVNRATT